MYLYGISARVHSTTNLKYDNEFEVCIVPTYYHTLITVCEQSEWLLFVFGSYVRVQIKGDWSLFNQFFICLPPSHSYSHLLISRVPWLQSLLP